MKLSLLVFRKQGGKPNSSLLILIGQAIYVGIKSVRGIEAQILNATHCVIQFPLEWLVLGIERVKDVVICQC